MDNMFTKYKKDFVASMRSVLDMLYNSKDLIELKHEEDNTETVCKYKETQDNIVALEKILTKYQNSEELTKEEQNIALAAMGTVVVHLEYLSQCYKEAAEHAKIIIANVKN